MKTPIGRFPVIGIILGFAFFVLLVPNISAQTKADGTDRQRSFCSKNYDNGDRVSFKDARSFTIPATGMITVDARTNGGVRVEGSNRSDVVVNACVHSWGDSEAAAKAIADSVRIETGGTIRAVGPDPNGSSNWSVSYEILVPRNIDLSLSASNGGISIKSVNGSIEFQTSNGGVSLKDLAGSVKGRTTNGGVNLALTGSTWTGNGLDVTTTNGGVNITVPDGYSANLETGTTNGGVKSSVPSINVSQEDLQGRSLRYRQTRQIKTVLNNGGATIRVTTTNGGVRIASGGSDRN